MPPKMITTAASRHRRGRASSAALAASGLAIAVDPRRTGVALDLAASSTRGVAETRAGLGGTFAALGLWALARGSSEAYTAVGVTWLGAAVLRGVSLVVDKPDTDWTFWAYLAAELSFGVGALTAGVREDHKVR
ncbi:MAG TPA: hypothetical protein VKQ71_15275 [Acidimicrobiales bacterium]|nr:hypothetical protein [Acidimicrobiales bacterium]